MKGVVINPVIAIDHELDVPQREDVRETIESRVVTAVERDPRFKEAKANIEESGYIDAYEKHGITFHMVIDEDGMQLNTAASSQQFLDKALLDEGLMTQEEYKHHTDELRDLAHDVADSVDVDDLM